MEELNLDNLDPSEMLELFKDMAWNDEYGCYTRQGFQKLVWRKIADTAKWIIYFDIDKMGELNEKHTHAGVNAIIKKCLAIRTSDYMTGQRYSGDEFMICVTAAPERSDTNPWELAMRLQETLLKNGVSATFAIAPVISADLMENVETAVQMVEAAKKANQRGMIMIVPGNPK